MNGMLDAACTKLRTLCSQLGIGIIMVSHLRRPDGRGHEDGGNVSLSQLRGSHAIAQLSDTCIGLQVDPDDLIPISGTSNPKEPIHRPNRSCWHIGVPA